MARKSLERPARAKSLNKVSRSNRRGQRTLSTNTRKINRVKSIYKTLLNNSKKAKEKYGLLPKEEQKRNRPFFCENYPTEKSFLDKHNFRKANL